MKYLLLISFLMLGSCTKARDTSEETKNLKQSIAKTQASIDGLKNTLYAVKARNDCLSAMNVVLSMTKVKISQDQANTLKNFCADRVAQIIIEYDKSKNKIQE